MTTNPAEIISDYLAKLGFEVVVDATEGLLPAYTVTTQDEYGRDYHIWWCYSPIPEGQPELGDRLTVCFGGDERGLRGGVTQGLTFADEDEVDRYLIHVILPRLGVETWETDIDGVRRRVLSDGEGEVLHSYELRA